MVDGVYVCVPGIPQCQVTLCYSIYCYRYTVFTIINKIRFCVRVNLKHNFIFKLGISCFILY